MLNLLFVRHGRTSWNESGRLQGQSDIGLSEGGCAELVDLSVPQAWREAVWFSSPLQRATHTARLLGGVDVHIDPRLQEMSWGQWEGCTLAQLREQLGESMRRNEARGLDFRPTEGESPRDVRSRVEDWLNSISTGVSHAVVITHKGVIRAALSLATGWDMQQSFAQKIDFGCAQQFAFEQGRLTLTHVNVPLRSP